MRKSNHHYEEIDSLHRMITIFGVMTKEQVMTYLDVTEEKAIGIMTVFRRLNKGFLEEHYKCIAKEKRYADFMSKALDVYLDFYKNGTAGDVYPSRNPFVACSFLGRDGHVIYEIVQIPYGEEVLANDVLKKVWDEHNGPFVERRRVVLLGDKERWKLVDIPEVFAYCVVDEKGSVSYYG